MADPKQVAPMDANQHNSSVVTELAGESTAVMDAGDRVCSWNGEEFSDGTEVESGGTVYECSFGNWVKA